MALRHLLLTCLATALALSGCAGSAEPAADVPSPGPEKGPGQDVPRTDAPAAETVVQGFTHDGMTALGACGYLVVASPCSFPASDNAIVVDLEGTATRVQVTLTWQPRADYRLGLFVGLPDGDSWSFSQSRWVGGTDGTLALDVDVSGEDAGRILVGANSFLYQGAAGVGGGVSVPFDFHLEGQAESVTAS